MTWTRLSDDFGDDCWTLSDAAFRLHVEGLVWNNRKLLDLDVAAEDVPRFAKRPEAVTELVEGGWWATSDGGYRINHHGMYQRDREAVLKQQAANEQNGRKGGRPPRPGRERRPSSGTHSLSESVTESVTATGSAQVPAGQTTASPTLNGTHWVSDSLTQRDGTGRGSGRDSSPDTRSGSSTTHLHAVTYEARTCGYCRLPFVPDRPTQAVHSKCPPDRASA